MRYCNCGEIATDSEKFCEKCGKETKSFPRCNNCGVEISGPYCSSCGWHYKDCPAPIEKVTFKKRIVFEISKISKKLKKEVNVVSEPFPIIIVDFPEKYGQSISDLLFGVPDSLPKTFRHYRTLAKEIKKKVCTHPELYALPEVGKERVIGWTIDGEKVFDETNVIDVGSFGGTFSASGYANKIEKMKGVVMAWLHRVNPVGARKNGMHIWPVELVIYSTNQSLGGF
ncbi:MAG: zinc ribbon domain-containing protein [Patescibacteria group bacterium]|nr:zinc ribbon domain-containing protein [Patescibacteria group bacterium]